MTETPDSPAGRDAFEAAHRAINASAAALHIAAEHAYREAPGRKAWVIDQMVRALTGDDYPRWVAAYCAGEDGPNTYEWNEGIAP